MTMTSVADRLDALDASLIALEDARTPLHVVSVMIFEPLEQGLDHERLTGLVAARIGQVTRYRQRVREMPGRLGPPVWVDDAAFDITYHVRRAALPRPGTRTQLAEFTARIAGRPLDRARPLWELYLLEGLEQGRFAVVTKVHQSLVDGVTTVDLGHLVLDDGPDADDDDDAGVPVAPRREPSDVTLLAGALWELATRPTLAITAARRGAGDVLDAGRKVLSGLRTVAATATDPAPVSPLNARVGAARRVAMFPLPLADFRRIRDAVAAADPTLPVTLHDVVLTVVAGGLRTWAANRGEPVHGGTHVRALVPVGTSDRPRDAAGGAPGSEPPAGGGVGLVDEVVEALVDLPVGEPSALARLRRVAGMSRRPAGVGARAMTAAAGFAPSTLHHLGARLGQATRRRRFNLVVTNVPGPQEPRFLPGARLLETYPILPLGARHALAVGVTSYDGMVCVGLTGDRAALGDVDLLGEAIAEDLADLLELAAGLSAAPIHQENPMTATRRVYLRLRPADLDQVAAAEPLPASTPAFAVTRAVREAFEDDDEEDLEYAAMWIAAGEDTTAARVVAAVDVRSADVDEAGGADGPADEAAYSVRLAAPVPAARIVSLHASPAGAGDDEELDWYDVGEAAPLSSVLTGSDTEGSRPGG